MSLYQLFIYKTHTNVWEEGDMGCFLCVTWPHFLYEIIQGKKHLGHDKFSRKRKIKIMIYHKTLATHIHGFNI
jgi:hypothetical protein